ncbi:MAG: hypothetical protein LUC27_03110, partial [Lachnospiraceae bacterium]|nr:hypothetical protein [Lachnospiraceae bacterium]
MCKSFPAFTIAPTGWRVKKNENRFQIDEVLRRTLICYILGMFLKKSVEKRFRLALIRVIGKTSERRGSGADKFVDGSLAMWTAEN